MHPKDPTKNTNPDELEVLLIADDPVVFMAIHSILIHPANRYIVRTVENFDELKTMMAKYKFEIVFFAITNDPTWFNKLVSLDVENKFKDVKIIIYTRFDDANTKAILSNFQNLNIKAIIKTGVTPTEINETVIAVHNGEELILMEIVQTKDTSIKKGKYQNSDGSYKMSKPLKELLIKQRAGYKIPQICLEANKDNNDSKKDHRYYSNMIAEFRKISHTHNTDEDIEWAEENNHIEKLEKN